MSSRGAKGLEATQIDLLEETAYREGLGNFYRIGSVERFDHADVRGW